MALLVGARGERTHPLTCRRTGGTKFVSMNAHKISEVGTVFAKAIGMPLPTYLVRQGQGELDLVGGHIGVATAGHQRAGDLTGAQSAPCESCGVHCDMRRRLKGEW